jgi:uncharacterized protein
MHTAVPAVARRREVVAPARNASVPVSFSSPVPPPACDAPPVAVAVMTKRPVAGQVKTRLSPPLTLDGAARLSHGFLLDTLARVQRLTGIARFVAFSPLESATFFGALVGETFALLPQTGSDLGERLAGVFERLLAAQFAAAVIIGTDSPTFPDEYLREAVAVLCRDGADVVLGPVEDGGYYLVGLRSPAPPLFQGVAWSTAGVLRETLDRIAVAGLRSHLLPGWFDVDTEPDLRRLARDLADDWTSAPHTRECLRTLGFTGERP